MPLTLADIRRQAVLRTLFRPTNLAAAIDQLGFVQIDPMSAPARAQDLILRHRVRGYRAGDLERRYPALDLAEDLIYVYGCMPSATMRLLHPRPQPWRIEQQFPHLAGAVLEFVRANGETDARSLEDHFGDHRIIGNWGTQARATTKILELLHFRGHLRIAHRTGTVRYFVAAEPPVPELPPEERLRRLVLMLARLYAPVPVATLKMLLRAFRYSAPTLPGRMTAVTDLLKTGALETEKVEGVPYLWPAGEWAEGEVPRKVRLLAPFDPVVWDRDRFEHIWGWPYRLEAYTPAPKRQFGRYALPLLWGDRVIGWANVSCTGGELKADLGCAGKRPQSPAFERELGAELERMREFLTAQPADGTNPPARRQRPKDR
jgi:uncharacterized protein YcaQ